MSRFDTPRALLAVGCLLASVASVAPKRWRALLAAALLTVIGATLWLPSPTLAAPDSCPFSGGGAPYAFQSWEAGRDRSLYLDAQRLAAHNELFPDDAEFALPTLMVGTGSARREDPLATIPAPLLFAIGWVESSTNQTAIGVPYGSTGPALISFDCGYGIMQITSKILNDGDPPTRFEALVGTHFAYNIAAGAQVLAEAWNEQFFPVVGDADPSRIESWYYALWAYNGWALENHPAGPDVDPFRAPGYRCDGQRAGYAYQELVLGCIAHPPEVDGRPLWEAVDVALPDLGSLAAQGGPLDPAHFYEGWNRLRSSGFVLDAGASAFAEMDMPLPSASRIHEGPDLGGAAGRQLRERVVGAPLLELDVEELELASSDGPQSAATLVIGNGGSGLLPWRVAEAPSWLAFDVSAGVAVGGGDWFARGGAERPSVLRVRASAGGVPEGEHVGELRLEASLADGSTTERTVTVYLNKLGAASYRAGAPQS